MRRKILMLCFALLLSGWASQSQAAIVNWNIDSANSFVRLNLPLNVNTTISGIGAQIRLRNENNATWSDAGGRRSNVQGTIATNYFDGSPTIQYLAGASSMQSINFGSFRPNPAQFSTSATNASSTGGTYTGTGGAPKSFYVRANANALGFVNVTAARLGIRDVQYDAGGAPIALTGGGGNYTAPSGGNFGLIGGLYDLDADVQGGLLSAIGQITADVAGGSLTSLLGGPVNAANTGALSITNLGGLNRRLDQVINIPLAFDLGGFILNASIEGQIRAFATVPVPEPASLTLAGLAVTAVAFRRRRRS